MTSVPLCLAIPALDALLPADSALISLHSDRANEPEVANHSRLLSWFAFFASIILRLQSQTGCKQETRIDLAT